MGKNLGLLFRSLKRSFCIISGRVMNTEVFENSGYLTSLKTSIDTFYYIRTTRENSVSIFLE